MAALAQLNQVLQNNGNLNIDDIQLGDNKFNSQDLINQAKQALQA